MIRQDEILADLHTHTNFSLHAYSTTKENVDEAYNKNLQFLAITDHFYGDGTELQQKNEITRIKYLQRTLDRSEKRIHILGGAEFNLNQSVPLYYKMRNLSWKIIGLHSWFVDFPNITLDDVYDMFKKAAKKKVQAFAQIERELHRVDEEKHGVIDEDVKKFLRDICDFTKEKDIYLEVNESSIINNDGGSAERLEYWLSYAKENGNKICMGTDSHYCLAVGDFTKSLELLNNVDFPKDRILNCNYDMLISLKAN